jgi:Mce-associated membrane protein
VSKHKWLTRGKGADVADTDSAEEEIDNESPGGTGDSANIRASAVAHAGICQPAEDSSEELKPESARRHVNWSRVFVFGLLPALALLLALAAGYLKWVDNSVRSANQARIESVQAAKDGTVALLSYKPDTVERQLNDATNLLAGDFKESYTGLINDVVIPGAKQKQISAAATVPAVASISADASKAVVLVFVDQTTVVGQGAPTDTASSVRVTLEKIDGRWLISKFDPV